MPTPALKLLLVDTSKLTQSIVSQAIGAAGVEVICCENRKAALGVLARQAVDFICAAAVLPDGDGVELCRTIRARPGCQHIPMALLTSNATQELQTKAVAAGVTELFLKHEVEQLVKFFLRLITQARPMQALILYVEDSTAQAAVVQAQLQAHDLTADWYATAESALAALALKPYELVLTDIHLGQGMNGNQLARQIRRIDGIMGDIPILAIATNDDADTRIALFNIGIDDYLAKPVIAEELVVRIKRLIENRRMTQALKDHEQMLESAVAERTRQYMMAQDLIVQSKNGMQELLDSMAEAAYGMDADGNCTFVNHALLATLGYDHPGELLGHNIHALIHHSHLDGRAYPANKCRARRCFDDGLAIVVEDEVFWSRAGIAIPVEYRASPIIKDGATIGVITTFIDIRDRQQQITALRDSEQHAKAIAHELSLQKFALDQHAIVATTDIKGRITYVNDKFCEISGYSRDELLGQDHVLLNSGHHAHGFFRDMYRTVANGQVWTGEVCNRAKNGSLYWVSTTIVPDMDEDDKPRQYVAIRADITSRKKNELELERYRENLEQRVAQQTKSLLEKEIRLRTIFSTMQDLIWLKDKDGVYLACNPTFEKFFGAPMAQIIGRTDYDFVAADQANTFRQHDLMAMAAGVPTSNEEWVTFASDGHRALLETTNAPMSIDGQLVGVLGVGRDITARKLAEDAIKASEMRTRNMLENSPIAVRIAALEGNRVVFANHRYAQLINASSQQAIGINPVSYYADPNSYATIVERLAHGESVFNQLVELNIPGDFVAGYHGDRPGDRVTWALASYFKIDYEGQESILAWFYDVTELELARNMAEDVARTKSEFLANMSHEIRTPMNGVIGMIDVLRQTPLDAAQQRMLNTVHESSLGLLNILNDILDFSKIEAGKLEIELIPTHLREAVEAVAQLMTNVVGSKEVQLSIFIDPALPAWIYADPTRLRQILFNLLGNAMKFVAPKVGHAMLHVHPTVRPDGVDCVQFRIIDNGIGMSDAVVDGLFQPFTQADASTARKFGGTGLGLSITQRLVQLMGGQIRVESTLGSGSEFIVEFPVKLAPAGYAHPALPDLTGIRVLAVTKTLACATLLQLYLCEVGADVIVVNDRTAARQQLQLNLEPQVLLLDVAESTPDNEADAWPPHVSIVQLTRRTHSGRPGDINVAARPLLFGDLIRGVALACGRTTAADAPAAILLPDAVPTSTEQAESQHRLILLAEDNETNREVMQEQLRLLGYAAEAAVDGLAALEMWRSGRFNLLLTDCHMPNMDGFELTAAIRREEAPSAHIPIIAVTANAMQGESERCLTRGMDDYLAKPLRLHELGAMLARWLPRANLAHVEAHDMVASCDLPVWDQDALTRMVGNNPAMHRRLLDKFLQNAHDRVTQMVQAAATPDANTVAAAAHALKSAARTVGAMHMGELCQQLEDAGHAGDGALCQGLATDLIEALAAVKIKIHSNVGDAP